MGTDELAVDPVDRCALAVEAYCGWLEEAPLDAPGHRVAALNLLANLYASALELPEIPESALAAPEQQTPAQVVALTERVMKRVTKFPLRDYWRIEEGTNGVRGESVQEDAARDLYLVYAA